MLDNMIANINTGNTGYGIPVGDPVEARLFMVLNVATTTWNMVVGPYGENRENVGYLGWLPQGLPLELITYPMPLKNTDEVTAKIKKVLDAVVSVVALATIMVILLVFTFTLRLRQREIQTIFKIGCSRMTIAKLLASEILIIAAASGVLCGFLLIAISRFTNDLARMLFIG